MVLSLEDKLFITEKALSADPARGLSAEHYRRKVGVVLPQTIRDSKVTLAEEVNRILGGLSQEEADSILQTNPYLNVSPANLSGDRPIIDISETNAQLLKMAAKKVRKTPIPSKVESSTESTSPTDHYDADGFYKGIDPPGIFVPKSKKVKGGKAKPAGKPKQVRRESDWNRFVKTVSKWNSLSQFGSDKMPAISILYKRPADSIIGFENLSHAEMVREINK